MRTIIEQAERAQRASEIRRDTELRLIAMAARGCHSTAIEQAQRELQQARSDEKYHDAMLNLTITYSQQIAHKRTRAA